MGLGVIVLTAHTVELKVLRKEIRENKVDDEHFDERNLTSYELERLEREEEFDDRITRLKEELAVQQHILRKGIPAEELHPLVHNLPHNIIREENDNPFDEEIAD